MTDRDELVRLADFWERKAEFDREMLHPSDRTKTDDYVEETAKLLRRLAEAGTSVEVKVKALEWSLNDDASSMFGRYSIKHWSDKTYSVARPGRYPDGTSHPTLEAAKAAAQADYEARITSALITAPLTAALRGNQSDGGVEKCAGGVDPGWDECPKCGATADDECAFDKVSPPQNGALKNRAERLSVSASTSDPTPSRPEPTEAQIASACLSYRHDYGLLPPDLRTRTRFEALEWLRAWQKEGFGSDRDEVIERCAVVVDQCNREGPYQAIGAAAKIRALKSDPTIATDEREKWRHKNRGTTYTIVGKARVQCESPLSDNETVLLYRDVDSGEWAVRRPSEYHDGRFERVP